MKRPWVHTRKLSSCSLAKSQIYHSPLLGNAFLLFLIMSTPSLCCSCSECNGQKLRGFYCCKMQTPVLKNSRVDTVAISVSKYIMKFENKINNYSFLSKCQTDEFTSWKATVSVFLFIKYSHVHLFPYFFAVARCVFWFFGKKNWLLYWSWENRSRENCPEQVQRASEKNWRGLLQFVAEIFS